LLSTLVAAFAVSVGGAERAAAQSCGGWIAGMDRGVPGASGIQDLVIWDPDGAGPREECLVACGSFLQAGDQEVRYVAMWDGSAWSAIGRLPGNGSARALAIHEGRLYVGGLFSSTTGEVRSNLLWWDGRDWQPVIPGPSAGTIRAMRSFGSALVVAGEFISAGGVQSHIARWTGSNWEALGDGLDGTVERLEEHGGALIAGGGFSHSAAAEVSGVARWDGAAWSAVGGGVTRSSSFSVRTLYSLGGSLYAGGTFDHAGGVSTSGLAHWDGAAWSDYAFSFAGDLVCVGSFGGRLVGSGLAVPNSTTYGTAYLDSSPPEFIQIDGWRVERMLEWRGSLYVAGSTGFMRRPGETESFDGITALGVARWDGTAWHALGRGTFGTIDAMCEFRGEVIAAGSGLRSLGESDVGGIARWDGAHWRGIGTGFDSGPRSLCVHHDRLYAGGRFTRIGTIEANGIAEWDGSAWHALGEGILDGFPAAMCSFQGELIAAVYREPLLNQFEYRIVAWNGVTWRALTDFAPGLVHELMEHEGQLVLAGTFSQIAGLSARNIVRWDGEAWWPMANGPGGEVFGMCKYRGRIHVTRAGRGCIYAWDEQAGAWITVDCSLSATPVALRVYQGKLIAGGAFHNATTIVTDGLAAWDGRSWRNLGAPPQRQGGPGIFAFVYGFAIMNDELFVGGAFDRIGGIAYPNWGRWKGIASDMDDGSGTGRCDGGVGIEDLLYYLSLYEAADVRADLSDGAGTGDPDGVVDLGDLLWYLGRFELGE
jgi:hypothetical protein